MHGDGADRVVDAGPLEPDHGQHHDHAGDETDQHRPAERDVCRACSDADEPGEHTVQGETDVRLSVQDP